MKAQTKEIIWNLVNSFLAGLISFLSALAAVGDITVKVFIVSLITFGLVAATKFYDYWKSEEKEYKSTKLFTFIK